MSARRSVRLVWWAAAHVLLVIALVGVFVPLLPTTPFALAAVFCAARGSAALHQRIVSHRVLGPVIVRWQTERAVSRPTKALAVATMAASDAVAWWQAPRAGAVIALIVTAACAVWIVTRPEPRPEVAPARTVAG